MCKVYDTFSMIWENKPTFDSIEDPAVQGFSTGVTCRRTDTCPTAIGQSVSAGIQSPHQGAESATGTCMVKQHGNTHNNRIAQYGHRLSVKAG